MLVCNENLEDMLCKYSIFKIAEIGVLAGKMVDRILLKNKNIEMFYMVDPWACYNTIDQSESKDKRLLAYEQTVWEDMYNRAVKVHEKHIGRTTIIRKTSIFAAKELLGKVKLDCAIIDADHTYRSVIIDVLHWLEVIRDYGILVGHDYCSGWPDVVKAVNQIFGDNFVRLNGCYWLVEDLSPNAKANYINICNKLLEV
jgi:hypothetical protein